MQIGENRTPLQQVQDQGLRQQKQLQNCSECKQYPCEQLQAFHHNGRDYRLLAANNLEQIRSGHGKVAATAADSLGLSAMQNAL